MLKLLTYLGPLRFVFAATILAILISTTLSAATHAIFFASQNRTSLIITLVISAVMPAIIAPTILFGFIRLFSELQRTRLKLELLASNDELTGVLNRRRLFEEGNNHIARALRSGHHLSVLMLDVDHFKRINDLLGHNGGDEALRLVSRVCASALRATDVFGRYGGEEFAIILWETNHSDAFIAAERIRINIMSEKYFINGAHTPITVSIGGATWSPEISNFAELLSKADIALYKAKAAGRNRVEFE